MRSGWVEVRDSAQHAPGGVLRDAESGEVVQPELELCPGFRRPAVFSDSDEVWGGALPRLVRFFCSSLAPGAFRRYRWEEAPGGVAVPVEWSPCGIGELEEALGVLAAPETVGEFGVPLCECITGEVPRRAIERRAIPEERRQRERAVATGCFRRRTAGLTGFRVEYRLAFCDFVEAKWNFFTGGDVELRLRFWFSGTRRPIHIMTGFGFPAAGFGGFAYYSQATRVRVPDDIIPGGCGEGIGVNNGVELDYADGRLVVASPDTPIAMFGGIHSRDGNKFHPGDRVEPQLWFSILNSFWNTNFAHAERDELECRFVFSRLAASPDEAAGELWSYPVRV